MDRNDIDYAILCASRDFHRNIRELTGDAKDIYQALEGRWPFKVIMRRVERLCDKGLLEYGVSDPTAWLTDKGKARLAELDAILGGK